MLVTGRGLYQFNARTMTGRTPLRELRPTDTLEISPDDAWRLGLADGSAVQVTSRHETVTLPAEVTDRVTTGTLFATFSDPAVRLNEVIGPQRDPVTHTPAYKVTAVALTPT